MELLMRSPPIFATGAEWTGPENRRSLILKAIDKFVLYFSLPGASGAQGGKDNYWPNSKKEIRHLRGRTY